MCVVRSRQICFPCLFPLYQVGKGIPVDSSLAHVPRATDVKDEARCDEAHGRCLAKCSRQRFKTPAETTSQRHNESQKNRSGRSFYVFFIVFRLVLSDVKYDVIDASSAQKCQSVNLLVICS